MIELFKLTKDGTEGRSGIDAFLEMDGQRIPFELKTTSKKGVTTVRDFGPNHIIKWSNKHWLIGFFTENSIVYRYGSPEVMRPWIEEKERYIRPDFELADILPQKMLLEDLYTICGEKEIYTLEDAKYIQKKQYRKQKYEELMDLPNGYSPQRMLEILVSRANYVLRRGATLNNPHIPTEYFLTWELISENHAQKLRDLVREFLDS